MGKSAAQEGGEPSVCVWSQPRVCVCARVRWKYAVRHVRQEKMRQVPYRLPDRWGGEGMREYVVNRGMRVSCPESSAVEPVRTLNQARVCS